MPLDISDAAILEKNKLSDNGTWLLLLEILYENENPIYLCLNNEEIVWNEHTWTPTIFSLSGIVETKDSEVPNIPLTIVDLNRTLIPILEDYNGGIGATVIIRVVHSQHLDEDTPELEESTEIIDVSVDSQMKIQFKLGAENLVDRICPPNRYLKNRCRFVFKGSDGLCGYSNSETECNRTYARCQELENSARFGGFPGIGTLGFFR